MANSKNFVWDLVDPHKATTKGDELSGFWTENKIFVATPTITNILGLVLVGLILYLG